MLLSRLCGVRQVSPGRWRARCPAHDGKNRNALSIGQTSDGAVLVRCFSHGCSVSDIVSAVDLELSDLFPPIEWRETGKYGAVSRRLRDEHDAEHRTSLRRPRVDWAAAVNACERDLLLVKIVLAAIARGEPIANEDAAACNAAADRVYALIQAARCG